MVQWLINKQNVKSEGNRMSLTKPQIEEASQLCSLVVGIKERVLRQYPIKQDVFADLVEQFTTGKDHQLELEFQSELQLKNCDFDAVQHITSIKAFVSSHTAKAAADVGKSVHIEVAAFGQSTVRAIGDTAEV